LPKPLISRYEEALLTAGPVGELGSLTSPHFPAELWADQARMAVLLLLTLRSTWLLRGEETGMRDVSMRPTNVEIRRVKYA